MFSEIIYLQLQIWSGQEVSRLPERNSRGGGRGGWRSLVWDVCLGLHTAGALAHRGARGPAQSPHLQLHVHQLPHGGQRQRRD